MHGGRCLAGLLSVFAFRTAASCRASRPQPLRTLSKPWLAGMADAGKGKQAKLASFFGGGAKRTAAAAAEDGEAHNNAPGATTCVPLTWQLWPGVGCAQPALSGYCRFPPRVSGASPVSWPPHWSLAPCPPTGDGATVDEAKPAKARPAPVGELQF